MTPPLSLVDAALDLGLPVFACNANKQPITTHGFLDATLDVGNIRYMFDHKCAKLLGVPTGKASGLVVIDVDVHGAVTGMPWLDAAWDRLPETRVHRTPSRGYHLVFRYPEGSGLRNSASRIAQGVDVRAEGGYVCWPAPGTGYEVAHDVPPAEMPDWLIEAAIAQIAPPVQQMRLEPRAPRHDGGSAYGLKALENETSAINRAAFGQQEATLNAAGLKIGALVAGGELDEGAALADLLSAARSMPSQAGRQPWSPYELERKARRAFEDGKRQPRQAPARNSVPISDDDDNPAAELFARAEIASALLKSAAAKRSVAAPPPAIFDVQGALRLILDHCNATAISPQPLLDLAAAIAAIGVLAGRKYQTTTKLRSNLYTVGIADSGGGKDHARGVVRDVFGTAGLGDYLGGEAISSGRAIHTALVRHPATLFQIDEFGDWLGSLVGKNAPQHRQEISTMLRTLTGSAASVLRGAEYANQSAKAGGQPRQDVVQPHACIYGTATPRQFWGAIGSAGLENGLVARLLVFVSPDDYPARRNLRNLPEPPRELIEALQDVAAGVGSARDAGASTERNLSADLGAPFAAQMASDQEPEVHTVPETGEAHARLAVLSDQLTEEMRTHKGTWVTTILARVGEQVRRLAMIRAVSRSPAAPRIALDDVQWGEAVAMHCAKTLVNGAQEHVADNDYERDTNRVLSAIRKFGPILDGQLFNRVRLPENRRRDIIGSLIASGEVVADRVTHEGAGRPAISYRMGRERRVSIGGAGGAN